ncbi:MAG: AAA family ATPase [Magnetococcales bacterium]|nr:AAA family ATPase [Magnetococcales bacterium]
MRIEAIRLKNFKCFRDAKMERIPGLCILVGANGTGKSTLFNVFAFLREAFSSNIHTALTRMGGGRGLQEVRSRNTRGPVEIELKFRVKSDKPLATYALAIDEVDGQPVVSREVLRYRRGSHGKPWHFLDFSKGQGYAVTNELDQVTDENQLKREEQTLKAPDILAIKGLANFERFPVVKELGNLIENWHISDFHINRARPEREAGYAEHLSTEGENLSLVIQFLYSRHRAIFDRMLDRLAARVPGISGVKAKTTEEGRVLLQFQDSAFKDPFLARYVSDGTIKMLAYLTLLYDPKPRPLLCVEEPENQLYPSLLEELAEEFRAYTQGGGQVFISTHAPDLLNAARIDEVFWLTKEQGYTQIHRAQDDDQLAAFMAEGDKMGYLWRQGLFKGAGPRL